MFSPNNISLKEIKDPKSGLDWESKFKNMKYWRE